MATSEWYGFKAGVRVKFIPRAQHGDSRVFEGKVIERLGDNLRVLWDDKHQNDNPVTGKLLVEARWQWTQGRLSIIESKPIVDARATAKFTERTADGFTRTALIADPGGNTSLDIIDADGNHIAQLNVFAYENGGYNFDIVIGDMKRVLSQIFKNGNRERIEWTTGPSVASVEVRDV